MAKKDLQHLVIALSKFTVLRNRFKKDPLGVMNEAGLSEKEKDVLASGDAERLRTYLGEDYSKGAIIRDALIRTAIIRDPIIRDPKK